MSIDWWLVNWFINHVDRQAWPPWSVWGARLTAPVCQPTCIGRSQFGRPIWFWSFCWINQSDKEWFSWPMLVGWRQGNQSSSPCWRSVIRDHAVATMLLSFKKLSCVGTQQIIELSSFVTIFPNPAKTWLWGWVFKGFLCESSIGNVLLLNFAKLPDEPDRVG